MSKKKKSKKPLEEYNATVSENGEILPSTLVPKKVKCVEPDTVLEGVNIDDIPMFWQIKDGAFNEKSQFIAIVLAVFTGMFAAHDWYLGLKKRALIKYAVTALACVLAAILFSLVLSEAVISYNTMFQSLMMLPTMIFVLWWSFDFITLATKRSKHFKQKDKATCVHKLKKHKESGGFYCKKCSAMFDSEKNFIK